MWVSDEPVALNGKLYIRGGIRQTVTVLEYALDLQHWADLPPPPVHTFTIATLKGQLLVVGGMDKSIGKKSDTIFTFDEHTLGWIKTCPAMPTARADQAVVGYQNHLVVFGGLEEDVNILDTASNEWSTTQSLPSSNYYYHTVLIEDNMYVVYLSTKTVLRAHMPTLISGAKSGVWETLPNTPFEFSSPVTISNVLLTVGGDDRKTSIQMYNPVTNQWTRVGYLPELVSNPQCIIVNSELFVFQYNSRRGYVSSLTLS